MCVPGAPQLGACSRSPPMTKSSGAAAVVGAPRTGWRRLEKLVFPRRCCRPRGPSGLREISRPGCTLSHCAHSPAARPGFAAASMTAQASVSLAGAGVIRRLTGSVEHRVQRQPLEGLGHRTPLWPGAGAPQFPISNSCWGAGGAVCRLLVGAVKSRPHPAALSWFLGTSPGQPRRWPQRYWARGGSFPACDTIK